MEVFDVLSDLKDKVQVDARQRKFVWPDGKRLTLQESIERARKRYPDISSKQIEEHLLYWTESGFAPGHYSREQFEELDRLAQVSNCRN
jgi:hypothetical protein